MGYTTDFDGEILVEPPLNSSEVAYLTKFNQTRRMIRRKGQYFVDGINDLHDEDILAINDAEPPQPGLWCQWVPSEDGTVIEWDQGEKFYNPAEWMQYLIEHFLAPGAAASNREALCTPSKRQGTETPWTPAKEWTIDGLTEDEYERYFGGFTFNHVLNGEIRAQGEDPDDRWKLVVIDNVVTVRQGYVVYDGD